MDQWAKHFSSLPMGASARDQSTSMDELGRKVYRSPTGQQYTFPMAGEGGQRGSVVRAAAEDPKGALSSIISALVGGVGSAIAAPGRAAMGQPVTNGDVWSTGGMAQLAAMPMQAPEGALRMFAGRTAKTADTGMLKRAEEMLAQGASRDDVWRDTGWFKGVDGGMRFEIDDSAAALKRGTNELAMKKRKGISESLQHDDLYSAYPDVADLPFRPGYGDIREYRGQYWPGEGKIEIAQPVLRDRAMTKSTTLHELQHAVQEREGFAGGGNFGVAYDMKASADQGIPSINQQIAELVRLRNAASGDAGEVARITSMIDAAQQQKRSLSDMAIETPEAIYRRISGEVEARNVQARAGMTAAERRATAPWLTQDTPDERQIVRARDGAQKANAQQLPPTLLSAASAPVAMGSLAAMPRSDKEEIRKYLGMIY